MSIACAVRRKSRLSSRPHVLFIGANRYYIVDLKIVNITDHLRWKKLVELTYGMGQKNEPY